MFGVRMFRMIVKISFLSVFVACKVAAFDSYVLPANMSLILKPEQVLAVKSQDFQANIDLLLNIEQNAPALAAAISPHAEQVVPKPYGAPVINLDQAASSSVHCVEIIRSVYYNFAKMTNLAAHITPHLHLAADGKSKYNTNNIDIAMMYVRFVLNSIIPGNDKIIYPNGSLGIVNQQNEAHKLNDEIEQEAIAENIFTPPSSAVLPSAVLPKKDLTLLIGTARGQLLQIKASIGKRNALPAVSVNAIKKLDKSISAAITQASSTIGVVLENLKTYRNKVKLDAEIAVSSVRNTFYVLPYIETDGEQSIRVYYNFGYRIGYDKRAPSAGAAAVPVPASILYIVFKRRTLTNQWYIATAFPIVL